MKFTDRTESAGYGPQFWVQTTELFLLQVLSLALLLHHYSLTVDIVPHLAYALSYV
jgi:hypothetical protein